MSEQDTESDQQGTSGSGFWPDETVDAISGGVVVLALVAAFMWFVMNG